MMRFEGEASNSNGDLRSSSNGASPSLLRKTAISNSANGIPTSSNTMNGSSFPNGHSKPRPTYFGHDREEVTRILLQALSDLGYNGAAGTLSRESGYELESPTVAAFRNAVLQGEWAEAEDLLFGANLPSSEGGVSLNGSALVLADGADRNVMRFWLRQQKFLELLEQRDTGQALNVLRTELTPLNQDTSKLHFLSRLLMCHSTHDLKVKAEWDGAQGQSRHLLLSELSRCISPSVMIPEHRLAVLLEQVKQAQISSCLYHSTAASPTLYSDHSCDRDDFPLKVVFELDKHSGEVYQTQFSHDGASLASCGSDGTAVIYDVLTWNVKHVLGDHEQGVVSLSWSPDDSKIVTCAMDAKARLWDTNTGECLRIISRFDQPVTSCVWGHDGQTFVTGSLSKEHNLCQWNLHGELIFDWGQHNRVADLAVSPDGNHLVAIDVETHVNVYNFVTRELRYELDLKTKPSAINMSQDSKYMLIGTTNGELQLIDIETREVVKKYVGEKSSEYVVRSAFGGAGQKFVIQGSQDGHVYIWHRDSESPIEQLDAHKPGCCTSVAWNPKNPCMFATGGDDSKVRIWSNGHETNVSTVHEAQRRNPDSNGMGWNSMMSNTNDANDLGSLIDNFLGNL